MLNKSSIVLAFRMSSPLRVTSYSSSTMAITDNAVNEDHSSNPLKTVSAQNMKRVLLLAGDAKRRAPSNDPLFGFAGTATAIEFEEGNKGLQFHFGTDGRHNNQPPNSQSQNAPPISSPT